MNESYSFYLIYHTEDSPSVDFYDCVYYLSEQSSVKYCQRLSTGIRLNRNEKQQGNCFNNGHQISFKQLRQSKVKPNDLFGYSVSIEQADKYASYLATVTNISDENNSILCMCIKQNTFGKYCEYQGNLAEFSDEIKRQSYMKMTNWYKYHWYGKLQCYETVSCDSGLRCLNWQDICDQKQQCMFGIDEEGGCGYKSEHYWLVNLKGTDIGESCGIAFGSLLADMAEYTQALKFYERLLSENRNVYTSKGEYDKVIIHFLEALMNRRRLFDDQLFNIDADIMSNIGNVYFLEGKDYHIALDYDLKAFEIQETCYPSNHAIIANALHNIANCYATKKDYHQALKYFNDS
ncbi:hypothetical protein I4U23_005649 [Adineta vaga]|nr:hypothetical protein I4U23_005649 [Adineta vaga]